MTNLPQEMMDAKRWVLWKQESRGGSKPTKVPYSVAGHRASSVDAKHWATYEEAEMASCMGDYAGLGFVLGGGFAGVDLDDCISDDGSLTPVAEKIIEQLDSYAEVSPSGKGVKIFLKGEFSGSGKNRKLGDGSGLEAYCKGRYFTVTGDHLGDSPLAVNERSSVLRSVRDGVYDKVAEAEPIGEISEETLLKIEKRKLLDMPEAVEGDRGHDKLFHAACEIRRDGYDGKQGYELLEFFNDNMCVPPFSAHELEHKWESAKQEVPAVESKAAAIIAEKRGFSLDLIKNKEFGAKEYNQEFLIDRLVVAGEHMVLGGPQKALKTSLLVDMAISLASGTPFLGEFEVPKKQPAMLITGESGGATLQKLAYRVQEARGLEFDDDIELWWGLNLPNLSLPEHLEVLKQNIIDTGSKLAVVDPAYLAIRSSGDSASNMFSMGDLLGGFGRIGVETGCTMCLAHHFRGGAKALAIGKKPAKDDLSFSGFGAWARQWLLVNHSEERKGGVIKLLMNTGGSAGHGGDHLITVDEGPPGIEDRRWGVSVEDLDPAPKAFSDLDGDAEVPPLDKQQPFEEFLRACNGRDFTRAEVRDAKGLSKPREVIDYYIDIGRVYVSQEGKRGGGGGRQPELLRESEDFDILKDLV